MGATTEHRDDADTGDPFAARVESVLTAVTAPYAAVALDEHQRPRVEHALWICACVSEHDAATWLVHDTADGTVAWCRVPAGLDVPDLVEARSMAGGHTDAGALVDWLEGRDERPRGDVDGDDVVFDVLAPLLGVPRHR